jgi:hypothetical protein
MLLFKKLLAYGGVGSASVSLRIHTVEHHRNSEIFATVTVRGGRVAQQLVRLEARLMRGSTPVTLSDISNVEVMLETQILAERLRIEAGRTYQFPCRFFLPSNLPLGQKTCMLRVVLKLNSLMYPYDESSLYILPEREFYSVAQAMGRLGFSLKNPLAQSWASGIITTEYFPAEEVHDQIQSAELHLHATATHLQGNLLLEASEKSLAERFKAFLGKNRLSIPVSFERNKLLDESGKMTPEGAVPIIRKALAASLILPDNQAQWMLRASEAPPTDTDELLRPAKETGTTLPSELLRSAAKTPDDLS